MKNKNEAALELCRAKRRRNEIFRAKTCDKLVSKHQWENNFSTFFVAQSDNGKKNHEKA
jgi:hypothetical protein